jgi:ribonuclease R
MPLRYTEPILDHIAHSAYRPALPDQFAKDMRISEADRPAFDNAIEKLIKEKKLIKGSDGKLRLPSYADVRELTGTFRLNPRGFGFFIPDSPMREGDLFIPPSETASAVSRDRVKVSVVEDYRRRRGGVKDAHSGFIGRVIEVIERGRDAFVGVLVKDGKNWFVHPDGRIIHDPVLIRDPHVKNAKEGSKVAIELVHYPDSDYLAEGVITEVLGEAGQPDVETQATIVAHGLRTKFPEEAVQQAREVSKAFEKDATGPWEDREDLTGQYIFTIDPPDAKDFDDAISIEYDNKRDEWTLGVHIADVSRFVTHESPLDEEAKARGNSVYLPRLVIPMLPEILSNGVCSLQEGVNRFTKSAFMTLDSKGNVLDQRAANTVIKSRKRLTYLEAQALIDGDEKEARKHARTDTDYSDELIQKLRLSDKLARILEKRRERHGMIVLNLPEVELVFDEDGHVVDAMPEDDAYTHKIIEMFMVEANEAMARLFESLGISILRRVHPDPVSHDLTELQMYALAAKQRIPDEPDRKDLQRLLNATRDTPAVRAIHFAVLRTLSKASYSPAMIGHYALASEHYAHFTSPIRRYPDLTLHRAIDAFLELTDNGTNVKGGRARDQLVDQLKSDDRVLDEGQLIELGRHCSDTEIEAEEAERELREFLVMQFLHEHHLGDEFDGVVTGMANKGVFVSIERFLIDGMVSMKNMPQAEGRPDRWEVNEATGRMYAKRSGQMLAIGDFVTVQIVAVDLASRHLDLMITKFPERSATEVAAMPRPDRKQRDRKHGGKHKGKGRGKGRRSRRR